MIPLHALAVGLLGLLLGLAAILVLAAVSAVVGLLFGQVIDEAFAPLPDDEPVPYLLAEQRPVEPGCCQWHDQARRQLRRDLAVARARRFGADRARVEWTAEDDAQVAELLRGGR